MNQYGISLQIEGNAPLMISGSDHVWYVSSGRLEVFLVPMNDERIAGRRRYCFTAQPGDVLYGMQDPEPEMTEPHFADSYKVIAIGSPGTVVKQLQDSEWAELYDRYQMEESMTDALSRWIRALSETIKTNPVPVRYNEIALESHLMEMAKSEHVLSQSQLVWVKWIRGTAAWMNDHALMLTTEEWFPMVKGTWVTAQANSALEIGKAARIAIGDVDSESRSMGIGAIQRGLHHFHRLAIVALASEYEQELAEDRLRIENRKENDRNYMRRSLLELAAVSDPDQAQAASVESQDQYYLACKWVGDAQRMEVKWPASAKSGEPLEDPVRDIARASKFNIRQIVCKGEWWREDNGPILGYMEADGRPVALIPKSPGKYVLHDPKEQTQILVNEAVAALIRPQCHIFYRPLPLHALSFLDVLRFIAKENIRKDMLMMVLMGVAGGLLGVAVPIATGLLFSSIIPQAEHGQLVQMGMILIVCALASFLFQTTRAIAMLRVEGKLDNSLQSAVWDRLLHLPVPFFSRYNAGDLAMRANSINMIRKQLSGATLSSIFAGIFGIFNFLLLFQYSVKLALAATGLVAVSIMMTAGLGYMQIKQQRRLAESQGRISGLVLQIIRGINKFRVTGAESRAFWLWASRFGEMRKISFKARTITNILTVFNDIFPIVSSMILFYIVISTNSAGLGGMFLAFFAAYNAFIVSMTGMTSALMSSLDILPLYERAKPILQAEPEVSDEKAEPGSLSGGIEINHVQFRYRPDQALILRDISLQIRPGEYVALVGSSGCGKSTLFRLLLGFEQPESGNVYYDGQDLNDLNVQAVRRQFGVVLQNSQIIAGDIFSNIAGSSHLTIDEAWEAARMAGLDRDIQKLPMGMHTVLSEGGGTLSGGQRQRVLIARAIAKRPRILFFDEATSALDNETQRIVSDSLSRLQATRIVIAHRLSTIVQADRIFVLDQGRIVQQGAYWELIEQAGLFADLARRQMA